MVDNVTSDIDNTDIILNKVEKPVTKSKSKLTPTVDVKIEEVTEKKDNLSVTFTNKSSKTIYVGPYFILSGASKVLAKSVAKALINHDAKTKYNINTNRLIIT